MALSFPHIFRRPHGHCSETSALFRRLCLLLPCLFVLMAAASCDNAQGDIKRLASDETPTPSATETGTVPVLRIAVSAELSPEASYDLYHDFAAYLAGQTGRTMELVQRSTAGDVNRLLAENQVDLALVGDAGYADGAARGEQELLAIPQIGGKLHIQAYFIVPADSAATRPSDLNNGRFAYADRLSTSAYLEPCRMLAAMGVTGETFFGKMLKTGGQDRSIEAVAKKIADCTSVSSFIYRHMREREPELVGKTRVIASSEPYPTPPVVAAAATAPALKEKLRAVLLHMHEDPAGRNVLAATGIDRFVGEADSWYDSLRRTRAILPFSAGGSRP